MWYVTIETLIVNHMQRLNSWYEADLGLIQGQAYFKPIYLGKKFLHSAVED